MSLAPTAVLFNVPPSVFHVPLTIPTLAAAERRM